jgi:hypothetical protein
MNNSMNIEAGNVNAKQHDDAVTECCIDFFAYLSWSKYLPWDIRFRADKASFNKDVYDTCEKLNQQGFGQLADFMMHICCWERLDFGDVIGDKYMKKCGQEHATLITDFKEQMLRSERWKFEPEGIYEEALYILNSKANGGSFLHFSEADCSCQLSNQLSSADRTCFVNNEDSYFLYKMLLYIESENDFKTVKVVKCDSDFSNSMTFDAVLLDMMWSMSGSLTNKYDANRNIWAFIDTAIDHMKEGTGRTVALVPTEILTSKEEDDVKHRKSLLEIGLIESVIDMPSVEMDGNLTKFSIVVLSDGNKSVKLFDWTERGSDGCLPLSVLKEYKSTFDYGYSANVENEILLNDDFNSLTASAWVAKMVGSSREPNVIRFRQQMDITIEIDGMLIYLGDE